MNLRPYQDDDWAAVCEVYDLSKPDELRGVVAAESIVPLAGDTGMCELFREFHDRRRAKSNVESSRSPGGAAR